MPGPEIPWESGSPYSNFRALDDLSRMVKPPAYAAALTSLNGAIVDSTYRTALNDLNNVVQQPAYKAALDGLTGIANQAAYKVALADLGSAVNQSTYHEALDTLNGAINRSAVTDAVADLRRTVNQPIYEAALDSLSTLTPSTFVSESLRSFTTIATEAAIDATALSGDDFASYRTAVRDGVAEALEAEPPASSVAHQQADEWAPTKEQAQALVEFLTFLVAVVVFSFSVENVPLPEQVKSGADALIALAVLVARKAR